MHVNFQLIYINVGMWLLDNVTESISDKKLLPPVKGELAHNLIFTSYHQIIILLFTLVLQHWFICLTLRYLYFRHKYFYHIHILQILSQSLACIFNFLRIDSSHFYEVQPNRLFFSDCAFYVLRHTFKSMIYFLSVLEMDKDCLSTNLPFFNQKVNNYLHGY